MRKKVGYALFILFLAWALSACVIANVPPNGCVNDGDCAQGTFCSQSGACVLPQDIACNVDADCPNETECDDQEGACFFP